MRVAFWLALVVTLVAAFLPSRAAAHLTIMPWDKAEHFLAFYVLTVLAAMALPRHNLWALILNLSLIGAGIELVQGLSIMARDRDFWDWVADSVAIAAALAPMLLVPWRRAYT
jgi:hypothetical protein